MTTLDFLSAAFFRNFGHSLARNLFMMNNFFATIAVWKIRRACHIWCVMQHWRSHRGVHHASDKDVLGCGIGFDREGTSLIDSTRVVNRLNDNFQELEKTVPEWDQDTQVIHPKWLEHHQSGHLTKDPGCPVCMEEAGRKVNHRRRKGDRSPGVMHCDLAAFEASADGHKYDNSCSDD